MISSNEINLLAGALAKAQAEMPEALFDSTNPHFRSKYASLSSFLKATKPVLAAHGLSVTQLPETVNGKTVLTTILMHSSGQFMGASFELLIAKNDMQGFGSALTYARRYALGSVAGIGSDDDDGNEASMPQAKPQAAMQPTPRPAPPPAPPVKPANYAPGTASEKSELSEAQIKRFWAMVKALGWSNEDAYTRIRQECNGAAKEVHQLTKEEYTLLTAKMDSATKANK